MRSAWRPRRSRRAAAETTSRPHRPRRAQIPHDGRPRRVAVRDEDNFGASIGWTAANLVLPGVGLLKARRPVWGSVMVIGALSVLAVFIALAVLAPEVLVGQAFTPLSLIVAGVVLTIATLIWIVSLVVTHVRLRPTPPTWWQRLVGALAVSVLSAVIAVPMSVGIRTLYDQADFVRDVFGQGQAKRGEWGNVANPWAKKPRLNVLVLGGDSGKGRNEELGTRTDTVIVASIDTATGETVLFQLPRQTARMPFPADSPLSRVFPYGFTSGSSDNAEYWLNAMYNNAPVIAGKDILGHEVPDLGAEIMKISVGEALGLPIDYFVLVDMDGFVEFIDAIGGVTVNVNEPVAMGGNTSKNIPPDRWLGPGPNQHLNGSDALWYARGRYGTSDYARGVRQRCVIHAVTKQADPATLITNYEKVTAAGRKIIRTDVPGSDMSALASLALKVKKASMRSIAFIHGQEGFSTSNPDWDLARSRVRDAIDPSATTQPAEPTTSPATPTATSSPSTGVKSIEDECGYHPVDPSAQGAPDPSASPSPGHSSDETPGASPGATPATSTKRRR